MVICRLREAHFRKSSLAKSGVGARSFAGYPEGYCGRLGVARSRGRAGAAGTRESRSKTGHSKTDSDAKTQSETTTTFISVLHTEHEGFQCVPRIYASLSIKPHVRPRRRALKLYNLQEEKIDSVQVLGWTDFCLSKRGGEKRLRYLVGYMKRR